MNIETNTPEVVNVDAETANFLRILGEKVSEDGEVLVQSDEDVAVEPIDEEPVPASQRLN